MVLRRAVLEDSRVRFVGDATVAGLMSNGRGVTGARTADGVEWAADLVVDASGRRSQAGVWLAALGMPSEIVMRHRPTQFAHIFTSDGYSAGYYSYLWADTLSADAFEAFVEAEGPYDKKVAKRLFDYVFSAGNTVDPEEGYRAFRGRDPKIDALMKKRGFGPEVRA